MGKINMILISEFINPSLVLFTDINSQILYFYRILRGGFIDLFPKKQRLFMCPDVILLPLTQGWLVFCSYVGEIISSSDPTLYKRAKQTTGTCRYFMISGPGLDKRVRGNKEVQWGLSAEEVGSMEGVCSQLQAVRHPEVRQHTESWIRARQSQW